MDGTTVIGLVAALTTPSFAGAVRRHGADTNISLLPETGANATPGKAPCTAMSFQLCGPFSTQGIRTSYRKWVGNVSTQNYMQLKH